MLRDINYDDPGVVNISKEGIRIVGELIRIGIWPPENRRALITVSMLKREAEEAQKIYRRQNHPGQTRRFGT